MCFIDTGLGEYFNGKTINWEFLEQFQWIEDMHGLQQDPIWHAEGDVYIHTKMVVEAVMSLPEFDTLSYENKDILVTAALLHDVEKRSTTTVEDGRVRSHGHAKKGEMTARRILYKEFDVPIRHREHICKLVRYHGVPLNILDKEDPNRAVIETSMHVSNFLLALLAKADVLGRIADDNDEQLEKIEYFIEYCKQNECYDNPKIFESDLGRYQYLAKITNYPKMNPYDDTKFQVIMMSGIPGAGKDTFIKKTFNWPVVSLDDIRREHGISPTDKSGNGTVIQMAKEKAREYMRKHENFIWNATNITKQMRQQLIDLFMSYGGLVHIYYIETPYFELLKQNKNREHVVPEAVIEKMINKLEPPTFDEAHDVIIDPD